MIWAEKEDAYLKISFVHLLLKLYFFEVRPCYNSHNLTTVFKKNWGSTRCLKKIKGKEVNDSVFSKAEKSALYKFRITNFKILSNDSIWGKIMKNNAMNILFLIIFLVINQNLKSKGKIIIFKPNGLSLFFFSFIILLFIQKCLSILWVLFPPNQQ